MGDSFKGGAATQDADDYINGVLKDPDMGADMERAQEQDEALKQPSVWNSNTQRWEVQPTTWQEVMKDLGDFLHREPHGELER